MRTILSSLAFSLVSRALAAPTQDSTPTSTTYPERSDEFTVQFSLGNAADSPRLAVILESDTASSSDDFLLVGRDIATYVGTPAYVNRTDGTALMFDLRDTYNNVNSLWGAFAANLGLQYNATAPVYTLQQTGDFEWYINGTITHSSYNQYQGLFACDYNLNGEAVKVLSYGVRGEEFSVPPNCQLTQIYQAFNLPNGATEPQ